MSHTKSNHPTDKSKRPSERSNPEMRNEKQQTRNQTSQDINRNEERANPSGRSNPVSDGSGLSGLNTEPWQQKQNPDQWNKSSMEKTGNVRGSTENSERSGQQYSAEGNSFQQADTVTRKEHHTQKKDQPNQLKGKEFSERERIQNSRGMNAPGMKNDQEMDHNRDVGKLTQKRDKKSDLIAGEE